MFQVKKRREHAELIKIKKIKLKGHINISKKNINIENINKVNYIKIKDCYIY
jgi:hypothetical protein